MADRDTQHRSETNAEQQRRVQDAELPQWRREEPAAAPCETGAQAGGTVTPFRPASGQSAYEKREGGKAAGNETAREVRAGPGDMGASDRHVPLPRSSETERHRRELRPLTAGLLVVSVVVLGILLLV